MSESFFTKEYASGLILFNIIDKSSHIGCITINNPSKRNAISRQMWLDLSNLLDDCLLNYKTIRVLILTGQGQISFCSGADLSEKEDEDIDHTIPNIRIKLLQFPLPIIAKINGYCLGGGLALAMHVDIRIACQNALFSIPAVKLGLACPKDIIDRLIKLVGESHAKMILYTGDRISAQQAYSIGLIQYVTDNHDSLDQYVFDLARKISCNAPLSVRSIKLMIENRNDDLAIKNVIDACRNSNDIIEGRNAFREKREANFQGQKTGEQLKQDAQQKGTELKQQAEQKGAEVKEKAGAAADAAKGKLDEVKDAANKKADELKPKVNEKVEQAKETGAQLADSASKKADEVKDAAENTTNTLLGTAIHAKDVTVEKVQELGHTVVETVQNIPEAAANAASFVGEKLTVAGQWAAEKASEVGTATMQSAQDAIHSLTGLAGEASAKAEETADKAKEKGAELKEQASDKIDEGKKKANELASDAQKKGQELKQDAQQKAEKNEHQSNVHVSAKGTAHNVSASNDSNAPR
ncbi:unnamed protein product [Rotaria sordida]|uniref:Enoyl-CoA hydratase n=2 Tax=Rotaria sordida TaxID=392033 RepID=A0A818L821_9BILA|nr:unnamed protein product [Rotaria sordida]CAF3890703.1 unnamed protein product [Rotaria sordida]